MVDNILHFPAKQRQLPLTTMEVTYQGGRIGFAPKAAKREVRPMQSTFQSEANTFAAQMMKGEFADIASRFAFPFLVYIGDKVMVLKTPEHLVKALSLYHVVLSENWLSLITSNVLASQCEKDGPCKISIENRYFATDGRDLGSARINYFGEAQGAERKIQMVEYLEWPCPERIAACQALQAMMA